jgi:signal transduction histidine kinase
VNTLEEARDAVWDLRHAPTLESAVTILTDLARKLGTEHRIQVETEVTGKGLLNPEIDRTILLVGREALRNAVAHANPQHIAVRLALSPSEVSMEVTDDGVGFVPRENGDGTNKHFGVLGMRERVEESGGSFRVESCPGKGTRVIARIPVGGHRK